jgi:hypothetical protein
VRLGSEELGELWVVIVKWIGRRDLVRGKGPRPPAG